MMAKKNEPIRGFYHLSEAWYGPANLQHCSSIDEVNFGMYYPEGGTAGEMSVRWKELGKKSVPQLQVFDDAWETLASFSDLLPMLAEVNDENITPVQFCEILKRAGFTDLTPRANPYSDTHEINPPRRETVLENALRALVEDTDSDEFYQRIENAKKLLGRK